MGHGFFFGSAPVGRCTRDNSMPPKTQEWVKLLSRHTDQHYYYNIQTGESTWRAPTSKISRHYNRVARETTHERKSDKMLPVRNLHNWLKNCIIRSRCAPGHSVLDLCCGKGGDIFKYKHLGVSRYTGVDFAEMAVSTARVRASSITFPIDLCVHDLKKPLVLKDASERDLVSAQFCLHYFWGSEEVARTFMENVSTYLKPGGHFIATFTDQEVLSITTSTHRNPGRAGNSLYQIQFEPTETAAGPFGCRYSFSSGSTVQDSEEYLVFVPSLRDLAREVGLTLVETKNFHEYAYEQFCDPECEKLLEQFRVPPALKRDEWEVTRNYRMAVFRKEDTRSQGRQRR